MTTKIDTSRLPGPIGLASVSPAAMGPMRAPGCGGGYSFPPSQIPFSI
jgi:hypothetical protein